MDKFYHFFISFLLQLIFITLTHNVIVSSFIVVCVGVLKEIYDHVSGKGNAEIKDLIADLLGIFVGYLGGVMWHL